MEVVNWSLPAVALWKLFVEDWDIRVEYNDWRFCDEIPDGEL
ncbi:hypothetical protein HanIR_Chr15g0735021 [Helianthus annuus]|nr:hypothetical protein HanIR_Chr15g0735021 [Helianthus annuus]